jgi:hypothetical protein
MTSNPVAGPTTHATSSALPVARAGMFPPFDLLEQREETARAFLARAAEAGIDHACCGDHVSFAGTGFDGLVQAAALSLLHPALPVYSSVHLLPLRHPVMVARQLADFSRIAPGRLIFGVGVGAEDRGEVSICGVDPASRGTGRRRLAVAWPSAMVLLGGPGAPRGRPGRAGRPMRAETYAG